ncbi:MAG: DUF6784 domain-containing protein [Armatimonadota bacterium]
MASTYAMGGIYFSVFLGWLIRWSCVRLGGLHSYRRFLPFFPGLLRGEALYGGLAALFGALTGAPVTQFLPSSNVKIFSRHIVSLITKQAILRGDIGKIFRIFRRKTG